jgi:Ras-related protein Rab-6A
MLITEIQRQVSVEEGEAKAREFGVLFIETSAKAGYNIKGLFTKVASSLPSIQNAKETKKEGDNCEFNTV